MTLTVKAAGAAQFLSLVPRLLGFTPTRSLVLVPMARGRTLGAMRLDLPGDDLVDTVASTAIGMMCRIAEADSIIAVVYCDEALSERARPRGLPGAALIAALGARADACGLPLVEAVTVGADAWGSHFDAALPKTGRPLEDLRVVDEVAGSLEKAGMGGPLADDQASGAALPRVPSSARRAVALALRSLASSLEAICGIPSTSRGEHRIDPAALEAACALDDLPSMYEQALAWHPAQEPMHAAMLGWCLSRPSLRDIALVQWATDAAGGDVAMDAQRRWEDGEDYPADLACAMWGEGPRPDAERLETALALAREVAALLPKAERPGSLAVCAWLSWALGRSSHADRYAGMALAFDPGHGLADIVRSFVHVGHLPDWAFRPR